MSNVLLFKRLLAGIRGGLNTELQTILKLAFVLIVRQLIYLSGCFEMNEIFIFMIRRHSGPSYSIKIIELKYLILGK